MAFLDDQKQQDQTQGSQPAQFTQAPQQVGNSGAADVGSGVSTAGVGAGGTGGWTNIQAYINANKDSNGGITSFSNTVGKQFDTDQNQIQSSSNDAKNQAKSQVDTNYIGQDQASQLIDQYNANDLDRTGIKGQFSNALNGAYSGPTEWSYSLSAPTQNYGDALTTDQGFQGVLNNHYQNLAGGQLNSGQMALQNQLDVNNPNVSATRSQLLARYKALQDMGNQTATDTNAALKDYQSQYGKNEQDLNNYLTNESGADKALLDSYYNPSIVGIPVQINPQDMINRFNAIGDFLGNGQKYTSPQSNPLANTKPSGSSGGGMRAPGGAKEWYQNLGDWAADNFSIF
jgi:hypothetical protein